MSGPARVKPSFAALCDATLAFATAVLRHRLEDTASVKLLRRFLAALLPQQADSDNGGNSLLLPHPSFSSPPYTCTNACMQATRAPDHFNCRIITVQMPYCTAFQSKPQYAQYGAQNMNPFAVHFPLDVHFRTCNKRQQTVQMMADDSQSRSLENETQSYDSPTGHNITCMNAPCSALTSISFRLGTDGEAASDDDSDMEPAREETPLEAAAQVAALASTIFLRLATHSRFPAIMMAPAAGLPNLPGLASRLSLPLASALSLCECEPTQTQVRSHSKVVCPRLLILTADI